MQFTSGANINVVSDPKDRKAEMTHFADSLRKNVLDMFMFHQSDVQAETWIQIGSSGAESQVWVTCFACEKGIRSERLGTCWVSGLLLCQQLHAGSCGARWDLVLWCGLVSCWKLNIDACFSVFFFNFCLYFYSHSQCLSPLSTVLCDNMLKGLLITAEMHPKWLYNRLIKIS